MNQEINYKIAETDKDFEDGKALFLEYATALNIDFSFQNFTAELQSVNKKYATPEGGLILAYYRNEAIGCSGIRWLEDGIGELKRLYVRDTMRGHGLGFTLMEKSLITARNLGYQKVRLDTLTSMESAIKLYETFGFYEIPGYCFNPFPNARFYEILL